MLLDGGRGVLQPSSCPGLRFLPTIRLALLSLVVLSEVDCDV